MGKPSREVQFLFCYKLHEKDVLGLQVTQEICINIARNPLCTKNYLVCATVSRQFQSRDELVATDKYLSGSYNSLPQVKVELVHVPYFRE